LQRTKQERCKTNISRKCHFCGIERLSIKLCKMKIADEANGNVRENNSERPTYGETVCNASNGKVCMTRSNDGSGTAVKNAEDYWMVDSGATHHVTGKNEGLYGLEEVSSMIELADATILVGKLDVIIKDHDEKG